MIFRRSLHQDPVIAASYLLGCAGKAVGAVVDPEAEYDFFGAADGAVLDLGNVSLQILHTPGHTPEHISVLGTDHTRGDEPWFVLSGHTLMVGDMGRTELASSAEEIRARNLGRAEEPANPV